MIHELANHLGTVRWKGLPLQAQQKLLLCIVANFSVAVAGVPGVRLPKPPPGTGHLLLCGGETGSARDAAFYNAGLMHARTQDDFHPYGNLHLATVILPAALAAAESGDGSGNSFLDAVAAGYTAAAGMSHQYSALTTPRGLRSTSLYTPFGATASVARLWDFDAGALANSLALTAAMSIGTTQCWVDGSDEWQLHVANGANAALLACELTRAGVRGGDHALDGRAGFYPVLAGRDVRFADLAGDLDATRAILETVLKRYPVSGICQPVVRLAEKLAATDAGSPARNARFLPSSIQRVTVEMNEFEMNYTGTLNRGPFRSFSDRLMSAAYCCASVLANGRFEFADFNREPNPARERLIELITVQPAADLGTLSCRIRIEGAEGMLAQGSLRDGGRELAIDWDSIDNWAGALWQEAGRAHAYPALRAAVLGLPDGEIAPLLRCF